MKTDKPLDRRLARIEGRRRRAVPIEPVPFISEDGRPMVNVGGLCFPEMVTIEEWAVAAARQQAELLAGGIPSDARDVAARRVAPSPKKTQASPGGTVAVVCRSTGEASQRTRIDAAEMILSGEYSEYKPAAPS